MKVLLKLFLISLSIHLLVTLFIYYAHFQPFSNGTGDYQIYDTMAKKVALNLERGFSLDKLTIGYYQQKGLSVNHYYPVIIGLIYFFIGPNMLFGQLFGVLLGALSAVFVFLLVTELGGSERAGFLTGILSIFYPSYLFFGSLLLKDSVFVPLVLLALLLILKLLKNFKWKVFIFLYISLICATHFRFYIGYALIITFVLSWFLFANMNFKKRIIYGIAFLVMIGFIPEIVINQGYYGIDSIRKYLNFEQVNFYRQVAYMPTPVTTPAPTATTPTPTTTTPAPSVSYSYETVGSGSSFIAENSPLGYMKSFIYVLFGPFPWQIKSKSQLFALFETIPWYFLLFFITKGVIALFKNRFREATPLLIFSIIAMVVIAIFEANFGIITRIRIPVFISLLCIIFLGFKGFNKNNIKKII